MWCSFNPIHFSVPWLLRRCKKYFTLFDSQMEYNYHVWVVCTCTRESNMLVHTNSGGSNFIDPLEQRCNGASWISLTYRYTMDLLEQYQSNCSLESCFPCSTSVCGWFVSKLHDAFESKFVFFSWTIPSCSILHLCYLYYKFTQNKNQ